MLITAKPLALLLLVALGVAVRAQQPDSTVQKLDSIFINTFEQKKHAPLKLLHAEPLYIDLIRDLGARKGEREWNFGSGLTDNLNYDAYSMLVEYEWAPADRLGLEVELPFTFYYRPKRGDDNSSQDNPGNRLNSLKLAAQYTFLVHEKSRISMAAGYLHEFLLPPFRDYGKGNLLAGHLASPFVVAARRWGSYFHTLLYTGPLLHYNRGGSWQAGWQQNLSLHYMLPGTRNFIGVETNSEWHQQDFDLTLRPQMRLGVTDHLLIGIVAGIPVRREKQRMSTFFRLIYEPAEHNRRIPGKHFARH